MEADKLVNNLTKEMDCEQVPSTIKTLSALSDSSSIPKYFPRDHELTKWLINQMRFRNGLHHLINFANLQPIILSTHFEIIDEPQQYLDEKCGPHIPAYSNKTILYLTPLAIAVYLGYKSVIQLLLDDSGSRLHLRCCKCVDVNATCYAKRQKPCTGIFGSDDYFTTSAVFISIRREFFSCLNLLMASSSWNKSALSYIDHIGTDDQVEHSSVEILEYAMRLIISRPGFDIVQLFKMLKSRSSFLKENLPYDVMAYEVYQEENQQVIWWSVFRRLCRKGVSTMYSNCGNRILHILEMIESHGFFRQDFMPLNVVEYDLNYYRSKSRKSNFIKRVAICDIRKNIEADRSAVNLALAVDRDICLALMTVWLNRMRNRCMIKNAERLTKLLLSALVDTEMLENFLHPPSNIDSRKSIWPEWLELAVNIDQSISTNWVCCAEEIVSFREDAFESFHLEPIQIYEIRQHLSDIALREAHLIKKTQKKNEYAKDCELCLEDPTEEYCLKSGSGDQIPEWRETNEHGNQINSNHEIAMMENNIPTNINGLGEMEMKNEALRMNSQANATTENAINRNANENKRTGDTSCISTGPRRMINIADKETEKMNTGDKIVQQFSKTDERKEGNRNAQRTQTKGNRPKSISRTIRSKWLN